MNLSLRASIVIPAHKPVSILRSCCESIIKNTNLNEVEVIVVCNGSDRESAEYVTSLGSPFKLIWIPEALGFTKAVNIGFELAQAPHTITLNTDVILLDQPKNSWLDRLLTPFTDPMVGLTGCNKMWFHGAEFFPFWCVAIRSSLFRQIGYLDLAFSPGYHEDADYCFSVAKYGYKLVHVATETEDPINKIYVTDFPIYHKGEGSFTDNDSRNQLLQRNAEIIVRRWFQ